MKAQLYAICALVTLICGNGCTTGGGSSQRTVAGTVVTVQYVNPGSFTDFSVQGRGVQYSTSVFTEEVTRTLEPVMRSRFPGDVLVLRFSNIDLAGRSTAGPRSVRVVRTRTPARLSFDFVLRDTSGRSVSSGTRTLVDSSPMRNTANSGALSTETRMLRRWLQGLSPTR